MLPTDENVTLARAYIRSDLSLERIIEETICEYRHP